MNIKVSDVQPTTPTDITQRQTAEADDTFRFTLLSSIEEQELKASLSVMMEDITQQGYKLGKKMDLAEMKRYRTMIKEFINEIVTHSHKFTRENFLDKKGRHRVYGMVKLVDQTLDELTEELMKDEKDNMGILGKIDEIRGLLLDLLT